MSIKGLYCLLITAIVIATIKCQNLTIVQRAQINAGLQAGVELTNFLERENFGDALTKVSRSISSFLKVIKPFIGFILELIPARSAQFEFMKEMMRQIDYRFNVIDTQLADIQRKLDWIPEKVNLEQLEQNIRHMVRQFNLLYDSSATGTSRIRLFIDEYNYNYHGSGGKLYDKVLPNGVFNRNLYGSLLRYTEYDRKKVQSYLRGILQLLTQAAKIELAYLTVRSFDSVHRDMVEIWANRIKHVTAHFQTIDESVRDEYQRQSGVDLDNFINKFPTLSHDQFGRQFLNHLESKYYWRDWAVVVSEPSISWIFDTCGGQRRHTNQRKVIIASVDKTKQPMNLAYARRQISSASLETSNWWSSKIMRSIQDIYSSLDTSNACLSAVFQSGGKPFRAETAVFVYGASQRLARARRYYVHVTRGTLSDHWSYIPFDFIMWG